MWTEWTEAVLTAADEVVVVSTLDLASLRNTKNIIDHLKTRRPNDADPILILNKTGMLEGGIDRVDEFGSAVGVQPAVSFAFEPGGLRARLRQRRDDLRSQDGCRHHRRAATHRVAPQVTGTSRP